LKAGFVTMSALAWSDLCLEGRTWDHVTRIHDCWIQMPADTIAVTARSQWQDIDSLNKLDSIDSGNFLTQESLENSSLLSPNLLILKQNKRVRPLTKGVLYHAVADQSQRTPFPPGARRLKGQRHHSYPLHHRHRL
jgi:hypothetical protein